VPAETRDGTGGYCGVQWFDHRSRRNYNVDCERRIVRRRRLPRNLDLVIVPGVCADLWLGCFLPTRRVQMSDRCCEVVPLLRVDVEKGRLHEPIEESGHSQSCYTCPHESLQFIIKPPGFARTTFGRSTSAC